MWKPGWFVSHFLILLLATYLVLAGEHVCDGCCKGNRKFEVVNKTEAKRKFGLSDRDLDALLSVKQTTSLQFLARDCEAVKQKKLGLAFDTEQ